MSSFVPVLIWALFVANALWPPRLKGRAGFVVYVLGMVINELPMAFLVIIGVSVVATWLDQPPAGAAGIIWAVAWVLIAAAVIWLQVRARSARPALESSLAAALGEGWRTFIRPDLAAPLRTNTPWVSGILRPFQRRRRGVERERNLAYGPHRAHRLDLYRNPAASRPRPVLIHFHEGGFVQGGKSREAVTVMNQLAAHGWLCMSANYRLKAEAVFPNPLVDAKRVLVWVRAQATDLGADPQQIFLMGCSAGGHMAVSAALTPNDPRFQPGFEAADTSVAGVVSLYGYLGARTHDPASSPVDLAHPEVPPMLLIQGANDTALPRGAPPEWAKQLRSASEGPVVYAELPHTQHAFDLFASVRARVGADAIEAFLAWVRTTSGSRGGSLLS